MDRGAWRATVHGVAESRTRLKQLTLTFSRLTLIHSLQSRPPHAPLRRPPGSVQGGGGGPGVSPVLPTGGEDAEGRGGGQEAGRGRCQEEEGSVQHGCPFWGLPGQGEFSLLGPEVWAPREATGV